MNTRYNAICLAAMATLALLSAPAQAEDTPASAVFFAHLLGGSEFNAAGSGNVGDQDGSGSATVITDGDTTVCYAYLINNVSIPVSAHIHKAVAGKAGPIVVTLNKPKVGNPGTISGCVKTLTPELVADIKANPSGYYINVHTDEFAGGALRGQLF